MVSAGTEGNTSTYPLIPSGLKRSRYAVIIDDYPQTGKHLLFNTFTHALVNIGNELKDFINNPNRPVGEEFLGHVKKLQEMRILVSSSLDETEIARKWYRMLRNDTSIMRFTILTTYDCNFACKYCIEEGIRKPVYLNEQCSDALSDWIADRVEENGTKMISLLFYGGEPLLNTSPIYRISERLQKFANDRNITLESSITTNGSLLNGEMLQYLVDYGLKSVKVTIDGEREIHNARRPFTDGEGSFDEIVNNISSIPEGIGLNIQVNLDAENMDQFPDLLDFFERSKLKDRMDNLVLSPIAQSLGLDSAPMMREKDCSQLPDGNMAYASRLATERGFRSRFDTAKYTLCSMNRSGSIVIIDPVGDIYNCPAFVGREGFSIGSIYETELDRSQEFSEHQLQECFQCTYFPVCGSGCRYNSYISHGRHDSVYCERGAIENQMEELIKNRYDRKVESKK